MGGNRNANRILKDLSNYLLDFRNGMEKVYYLNQEGCSFVNSKKTRHKNQNIDHVLLRNQFYIYTGKPDSWRNEVKVKLGALTIIPDAMFNDGTFDVFLEVDMQQTMQENANKVARYKRLKQFTKKPFMLVFVTDLESRRQKLIKLCEGLTYRIYSASEIM
ncbi:replication-relaxation family protein [Pullulanibacillus sp. KACC 23026]|uniref:replication-relaxation family protein n=1 Tax=Pullulanibacillus sp. KACC 23026 TaxID=3028315 RepID=UPI0023B08CD9|nr:replication-relaxation family protein [Pullulanibacillus sp. KACC 23026]WEG14023.1 replication-relaxation family protein [Pullulanibacillus sp. KACC 23026]